MPKVIEPAPGASPPDRFVRRVIIAIAIAGLTYVGWQVREVVMIIFGGVLVATLLVAIAGKIRQVAPLPEKASVAIAVLAILLLFGVTGWWIGDGILKQFGELREKLPQAMDAFQSWLQNVPIGSAIASELEGLQKTEIPWGNIAGLTGTALGALANAVLILAIGLYLAASPMLYRQGLLSLIPQAYRSETDEGLLAAAGGLRSWLLGQLLTMAVIGALTTIGLYLLGIPLALPLGIIAGLLEFVPFIGPLVFGVVAVMFAFSEGPTAALYVAFLTLAIQQLEGNVLTPIIQKRTVSLPPALGLVAVVIFGVLFGIPGILFATPLMVVVMILVKKLYIENALQHADEKGSGARPTPDSS